MHRMTLSWRSPFVRMAGMFLLLATLLSFGTVQSLHSSSAAHAAGSSCQLNSARGNIQHVIYIQFDNTHFTRDNPNVPSDLEQMPNLLNFIKSNGVLLTNHHTPLISHTATDILTSLTGVYGDRHGVPVSNSFRYFNPNGTSNLGVSFAYWTDPLYDPTTSTPTDTTYNMLTAQGMNAPAPWVPYTRAGCNVGAVATANIELENIATDIPTVFGANSPQAAEVKANPDQATADFVGISVHCARGNSVCSSANGGMADVLPQEPHGYSGFNALYGHKYVAPQINPGGPIKDLFGNVIKDPSTGDIGFPGFGGITAAQSLSYVAAMQEHNVPVTYAYIADAHDNHTTGSAYGPGQAGYVAQLKSYNDAFGKFFTRLANDGINSSNTLFVFTADEGDHFIGGHPSPAGCDGVTTPCTYSQIGEISTNLKGLLATQQGITTPFAIHSDDAPTVYITGNPASDAPLTRNFERATGQLTAVNPYTGNTDTLTKFLADPVEMKILHMVTADPARTPTFTMFGDPNYFLFTGAPNCSSPCVTIGPGFAWNHGDVQPEITTTWLGMVGPGVRALGVDNSTWSDHTDIRPTMMMLVGLKDDYSHDGRALFEDMYDWAVPQSLRAHRATLTQLAQVYKQLNADVGQFGLATLRISTKALESNAPNDSTYTGLENQLISFNNQRDALASQMIALLEGAGFSGQSINEQQAKQLISQGQALLNQVNA
jgi:hypothetical protein